MGVSDTGRTEGPPQPLTSARGEFDVPDDVAYLNAAYMTPKPRRVTDVGIEAVRRQQRPWTITASDFFDDLERLRVLFAGLVGGDADGVAVVPAASYALSTAAANVSASAGQRIVVLADQYPSNVYPWRDLAQRSGATVLPVPQPATGDWSEAVLAAIDERTAVVAVPHCHFATGAVLDLPRLGARAREVGATFVVDATQSLGVMPLDVAEIGADVVVAAGYKWLLGPYSVGYSWTSPRCRHWRPLEHHWAGRSGSDDFARLTSYTDEHRPGSRRFDGGEASNFVLVPMAVSALRAVTDWSPARVSATIAPLAEAIVEEATALGLEITPPPRADHILGARLPAGSVDDVQRALSDARVHVSVRGSRLRISPYVYNTEEDIVLLLDALRAAV